MIKLTQNLFYYIVLPPLNLIWRPLKLNGVSKDTITEYIDQYLRLNMEVLVALYHYNFFLFLPADMRTFVYIKFFIESGLP